MGFKSSSHYHELTRVRVRVRVRDENYRSDPLRSLPKSRVRVRVRVRYMSLFNGLYHD